MTKDKYCTFCEKELGLKYFKNFWTTFCSIECRDKYEEQLQEQIRNQKGE
ncbi:hypothetical protein [Ureaplasma parvum]|nr:hypothetical protein [Ureaplasma parvum]